MSESAILWSLALGICLVAWLSYYLPHRRRVLRDDERLKEAQRLQLDRPTGQYPYIDPLRCVGCSACVDACPEGDVLGMVGGIAVIVNGLRCIGIAACEAACPVGAVTIGMGDTSSRRDLPLLDDGLQTSLPNVYIAGELGGMSLVSHAVRQGRSAVTEIAKRIGSVSEDAPREPTILDLLVVGAGPAGISAGLTAQELALDYLILEREPSLGGTVLHYPRRKMVLTQPVPLGSWGKLEKDSYEKQELMALLERLVLEAGLQIRFGETLTDLIPREGHYEVGTTRGTYRARHIVLALGRRGHPRKLGVPGEERSKVAYRLIDASSYQGRRILVVGGGDSAVEAAMALVSEGNNQVSLSYRKERLVRIKKRNQDAVEALFGAGRLQPLLGSQVCEIGADSVTLDLADGSRLELPNDEVFVCIGGQPPFDFLASLGIRFGGEPTFWADRVAAANG